MSGVMAHPASSSISHSGPVSKMPMYRHACDHMILINLCLCVCGSISKTARKEYTSGRFRSLACPLLLFGVDINTYRTIFKLTTRNTSRCIRIQRLCNSGFKSTTLSRQASCTSMVRLCLLEIGSSVLCLFRISCVGVVGIFCL
jgi:hypothetical protein